MNNIAYLNVNEVYEDIETFLQDVEIRSHNTYKRYKAAIELFFKWHVDKNLNQLRPNDIKSIDYNRMKQFRSYLKNERNNTNSTVNNTLSSMYSLLRELKKINRNKYSIQLDEIYLKRLDQTDEQPHGDIEWEESEQMIEYVKSMPKRKLPETKAALIHIARMTGIRLSGLLNLTYKDLRHEYGLWVIHHSLKGKKHSQAIRDEDAKILLDLRENKIDDNEKIFKLSSKTVERMMAEIIDELGIDKNRNISFHSIRRLYGGEVYAATGNNLIVTQQFLGHSDPTTTERYIQRKQDIQKSPALFIGENMDEVMVDSLEKEDWQKIFKGLSRGTQYEIINKIKELGMKRLQH